MGSLLLLGFLVGVRHAMEADHMAALASMATRNVRSMIHQGIAWGLGHTLTLFLFGGIALALETTVPRRLAEGLEFAVGVMLMVLGADLLRRTFAERNTDLLAHGHEPLGRARFPSRALAVGLMHGMAGSAALILIALGKATTVYTGLFYILAFGVGSMVGMATLSAALALPLRYSANRLGVIYPGVRGVVGLGTLALGAGMAYRIGSAGWVS